VKRHPEAAGAAARCFAPREAAAAYVYARLELPCSFIARHGILHPGPALPSANRSHSSRGKTELEQGRMHAALHAICFVFT